jgi:nucleoside diphosphate kinase
MRWLSARLREVCALQLIGATNPTAALPGSIRQKILAEWEGVVQPATD